MSAAWTDATCVGHKAHEELVAVVRGAGVQDLDLAAVACKALHNLRWTHHRRGAELREPPRSTSGPLSELGGRGRRRLLAAAGAVGQWRG